MSELKPPASATATAGAYHDFASLGALRGQASRGKAEAAREAAVQFEAHFVQQMLKTMRESVMKSDLVESGAADTYQDMMDKEVSLSIARGRGLGLATMLERELHKPGISAMDALRRVRPPATRVCRCSAPALRCRCSCQGRALAWRCPSRCR